MSSKPSNPPPPQTTAQATLTGVGNLIKLLPTGTVFAFQFLNPVLTNNGQCHPINKYLTSFLITVCGLSCCFASFTDSYTDNEGNVHYGVATTKASGPPPPRKTCPPTNSVLETLCTRFSRWSCLPSYRYLTPTPSNASIHPLSPLRRLFSWQCRPLSARFQGVFSSCFLIKDMA